MFYEGALAREKKRQQKDKEAKKLDHKKRFQEFWSSFKRLWNY